MSFIVLPRIKQYELHSVTSYKTVWASWCYLVLSSVVFILLPRIKVFDLINIYLYNCKCSLYNFSTFFSRIFFWKSSLNFRFYNYFNSVQWNLGTWNNKVKSAAWCIDTYKIICYVTNWYSCQLDEWRKVTTGTSYINSA